jgi:hypothetical protein
MALVWSCLCSFGRLGISHCDGGTMDKSVGLVWSRLSSLGLRELSYCCGGPIGKGDDLVSPLFLWLAWAHLLWWWADRQGRWSVLVSLPLFDVGSVFVVAGR